MRPVVLPLALALVTVCLAVLGCGDDPVTEPVPPATQWVILRFTGSAQSNGQPVSGAVIEYSVYPCPYFEGCGSRTISDTTDALGGYAITAARTCVIDQSLTSVRADTVTGDRLHGYLPLGQNVECHSPAYYGPTSLHCTNSLQELDFDFSHCPQQ